jgi:hypothetical protein
MLMVFGWLPFASRQPFVLRLVSLKGSDGVTQASGLLLCFNLNFA